MSDFEQLAQEFRKYRDEQKKEFQKYRNTQSDIIDGLIQSAKGMAKDLENQGTEIDEIKKQLSRLLGKFRNEVIQIKQ
jgi:uncharacterized coiled-coil DUF342 family protein